MQAGAGKMGNGTSARRRAEYDLIIFDCDGVLVDSEALSCACLQRMLGEFGYSIGLDEVFDTFLGRSFAAVRERYQLALGYPLTDEFVRAHRRALRACFEADLQPVASVPQVLAEVATPSCVASSSDRERLLFTLNITGLAQHFRERVFSADQVARGKPAPDLFLHAAAAMDAAPERTLVVEDSVTGVRAGRAAGMTVWGFVGGSHYKGRDGAGMLAAAGADRVFTDFTDLRGL